MTTLTRIFPLVGRVLLSLIFVAIAIGKVRGWSGFSEYMVSKQLPLIPVLLAVSLVVELAGGLSILLGWRARLGALVLLVYLIPVTVLFHNFWQSQGVQVVIEGMSFLKNVAIMGGLLLIVAFGPGPFSVDSWRRRRIASQDALGDAGRAPGRG
jgi:putative oxidoreductase